MSRRPSRTRHKRRRDVHQPARQPVEPGREARNICSESRVRNRISPIQMNSGSAASAHEALLPHTTVASTLPAGDAVPAGELHPDEASGQQRERDPQPARQQHGEEREQDQRRFRPASSVLHSVFRRSGNRFAVENASMPKRA